MNVREALKHITLLGALALFVLAYGLLPASAEQAGAKAQKAKPASSVKKSTTGAVQPVEAVAVPGTPLDTPGGAAGMVPPERPPMPESQRTPDLLDIPEGKASSGRVEPPGPVPSGPPPKAGIIGDTGAKAGVIGDFGSEAMTGPVRDPGPTTPTDPPPKNELRATGGFGAAATQPGMPAGEMRLEGEATAAGTAGSPPIPGDEGAPPPRPPGPKEAPPGN